MKQNINKLNAALSMNRMIIGIKFISCKSEFDAYEVQQVKYKLSYCKMIEFASKGKSLKANLDNSGCNGAINALGFKELDNAAISGKSYYSLGMYDSIGTAKKTQKDVSVMKSRIYGVVTRPLEEFTEDPDVIMFIVNSYNAMRIVQGYSFHHAAPENIKFSGNQGICLECTATPYENNDINVSVLCSNTRFLSMWDDNELGIGIPYNMFESLVDGVVKTINPSETDNKKQCVIEKCNNFGCHIDVKLGENYYLKTT